MNEALLSRGCSCRACAERLDAPLPTYPRRGFYGVGFMVHLSRVTGKGPGCYALVCVLCCPVSRRRKNGSTRSPLRPPNINERNGLLDTLAGIHVRDHPGYLPPAKDG